MRLMGAVLGVIGLVLGSGAVAVADERADWGVAVTVGAQSGSYTVLLKNDSGYHLVVVDPEATITGAGLGAMTFGDIRPDDRIDYAVATFAGMDVVDMMHVTPQRHAEVQR